MTLRLIPIVAATVVALAGLPALAQHSQGATNGGGTTGPGAGVGSSQSASRGNNDDSGNDARERTLGGLNDTETCSSSYLVNYWRCPVVR